jgi:predicted nucleic acid-binding protein
VILLDTSAVYALASARDPRHGEALALAARLAASGEPLLVHSYVLCETFALLHRRRSLAAALEVDAGLGRHETVVVDRALHDRAVARLRAAGSRRPSLVDAVSFELMKERRIRAAFAFDPDFESEGFRLFGGD